MNPSLRSASRSWAVILALLAGVTLAATPTGARADAAGPVVIIGIDGLSFDVLDPLARAERVPHLAALMEGGARAVLKSEKPMRSPALWTTIATGQPRDVHRIYDFVTGSAYWPRAERSDDQRLVTSDMRQAPALWEIASQTGKRSLVVGWLNSWPAEAIDGVMVAPYVALGTRRQTSIKGKIYDDVSRQTHPTSLFAELKPLIVPAAAVEPAQVARLVDEPAADSELMRAIPKLKRYLYTVRWSIAGALTNVALLEDQLADGRFDLVMTYLDGADTLGHRFWLMRQPEADIRARLAAHGLPVELAPELKRRFGGIIDNYYVFADELVGRIAAAAGPNATLVVISDHGWGSLSSGPQAPYDHVPFDGEHRLQGVFIANGPHVRPGRYPSLSLYEIAPTTLYLLGLRPPAAMPGRVATMMLDDCLEGSTTPVVVDRRRTVSAPEEADVPHGEEELERLRSLGYVR